MKLRYEKSIELAMALGYEEILNNNAFQGRCYVKNDKIWIYNIEALKATLGIEENIELDELDYDVEAYMTYRNYNEEMANSEMKKLYSDLSIEDGEPIYLSDGVYLFPDGSMRER